jgi:hypothetical protein
VVWVSLTLGGSVFVLKVTILDGSITVAVEESNRSRFQAPPSAFIHSTKANSVRMIRNRAMDNQTYSSSVIPFGSPQVLMLIMVDH